MAEERTRLRADGVTILWDSELEADRVIVVSAGTVLAAPGTSMDAIDKALSERDPPNDHQQQQ